MCTLACGGLPCLILPCETSVDRYELHKNGDLQYVKVELYSGQVVVLQWIAHHHSIESTRSCGQTFSCKEQRGLVRGVIGAQLVKYNSGNSNEFGEAVASFELVVHCGDGSRFYLVPGRSRSGSELLEKQLLVDAINIHMGAYVAIPVPTGLRLLQVAMTASGAFAAASLQPSRTARLLATDHPVPGSAPLLAQVSQVSDDGQADVTLSATHTHLDVALDGVAGAADTPSLLRAMEVRIVFGTSNRLECELRSV